MNGYNNNNRHFVLLMYFMFIIFFETTKLSYFNICVSGDILFCPEKHLKKSKSLKMCFTLHILFR